MPVRTLGALIALLVCASTVNAGERVGLSTLANEIERSDVLAVLDDYPTLSGEDVRVLVLIEGTRERPALIATRSGALYFFTRPAARRARESAPQAPRLTRAEIADLIAAIKKRPVALKLPKSWIAD